MASRVFGYNPTYLHHAGFQSFRLILAAAPRPAAYRPRPPAARPGRSPVLPNKAAVFAPVGRPALPWCFRQPATTGPGLAQGPASSLRWGQRRGRGAKGYRVLKQPSDEENGNQAAADRE